ncbi:ferredoxin-thioredoxin reductase catalytic domain-containing protein [Patescibacteria group bacterium]
MKIYRCAVCGYIYQNAQAPCECPFCRNKNIFDEIPLNQVDFEFFKNAWSRQVSWMNNTKYQIEIQLNPDESVLKDLAQAMGNFLKDGKQAYCPCRVLTGNELADKKIICPCYFYMGEIELEGKCHCSLYIKK